MTVVGGRREARERRFMGFADDDAFSAPLLRDCITGGGGVLIGSLWERPIGEVSSEGVGGPGGSVVKYVWSVSTREVRAEGGLRDPGRVNP